MNTVKNDSHGCIKIEMVCGTVYGLSIDKIWEDFKRCVMVVNEVNELEASAIVEERKVSDPDHWKAWFNEQYTMSDVIEDGFLISNPGLDRVKELAEFYRNANGGSGFKFVL